MAGRPSVTNHRPASARPAVAAYNRQTHPVGYHHDSRARLLHDTRHRRLIVDVIPQSIDWQFPTIPKKTQESERREGERSTAIAIARLGTGRAITINPVYFQ